MADFDLAVIGAGANGAAVARDAAGRGVKVVLLEQNDLASGASLGADMLVRKALGGFHGGPLVWRTALAEREVMARTAPHLVRTMRLLSPPAESGRPPFRVRARLFACDHLARRRILPAAGSVDLTHHPFGTALKRQFDTGFVFSDCRVDEVRLPIANVRDAAERGAAVLTRTRCLRAERRESWTLILNMRGDRQVIGVRAVVNAAGAMALQVSERAFGIVTPLRLRRIKETFIAVDRLFDHDGGYLLSDRRGGWVLALPFDEDRTLIGPAEQDYSEDEAAPAPSAAAIETLCALGAHYFRRPVGAHGAIPFAHIRGAAAGPSAGSRIGPEQALHVDRPPGLAPLVTICGGAAIGARRLAEAAVDHLTRLFHDAPAWTAGAALPGGDFGCDAIDALVAETERRWPFLDPRHARRLVLSYGTRVERILGNARGLADLGARLRGDLTAAEVRYLLREEWAETADDVLWRRSRLGLGASASDREALARFIAAEPRVPPGDEPSP